MWRGKLREFCLNRLYISPLEPLARRVGTVMLVNTGIPYTDHIVINAKRGKKDHRKRTKLGIKRGISVIDCV